MNIKLLFQLCEKWLETRDKELRIHLKKLIELELLKINNNFVIEDIEEIKVLRNEIGVKFMATDKYSNRKEKAWVKYYGAVKMYHIYINNTTVELSA